MTFSTIKFFWLQLKMSCRSIWNFHKLDCCSRSRRDYFFYSIVIIFKDTECRYVWALFVNQPCNKRQHRTMSYLHTIHIMVTSNFAITTVADALDSWSDRCIQLQNVEILCINFYSLLNCASTASTPSTQGCELSQTLECAIFLPMIYRIL